MYRSSSWTSDEYSNSIQSSSSSSSTNKAGVARLMPWLSVSAAEQLPLYDEGIAEMAKRERARVRLAENAVHLIPLVLILCALILWLFSTTPPGTGAGSQGEPIASRIEGLSIEGEIDNDSDGMQIGVIPTVDLGGIDSPRRTHDHKASRKKDQSHHSQDQSLFRLYYF